MTRNAAVLAVLMLLVLGIFACAPPAGADAADWQFRCDPFLGAGLTFLGNAKMSVTLGLEVLTFPDTFPILAGKDVGGYLATTGDDLKAAGLGLKIAKAGDVSVWVGGLIWKDDSVKADAVVFLQKPFTMSLGW